MNLTEKEEKLLRCWNCKNIINILETKECKHPAQTQICPYCKKCLCQNPKFRELKRIDDGDGRWHVGRYLEAKEILFSGEPTVADKQTETEKILDDKKLMASIRKERQKGTKSSPYKPLSVANEPNKENKIK